MTDQGKISIPEQGTTGKSLIERATEGFDLKGFAPAPMPTELPPPPSSRLRKRQDAGQGAETRQSIPAAETAMPGVPASPAPASVSTEPPIVVETPAFAPPKHVETAPKPAVQTAQPIRFADRQVPVDRSHLREQGLIEPEGAVTALLEEFRIVKRQLLHSARNALPRSGGSADPQRVLICSPHPGEGKTFCAVNLALAIAAEKDSEVLLVDADFAKPSVLTVLGLPGGRGLMDALADPTIRVEDCVIGTDIPGLWVLPAGNPTNADSEYLSSNRTAEVLDRLTRDAPNRIVIFDSPPALAASPAAELAKYAGQAVLVVRADQTGQSALDDAISLLSDCPDIKLLLNAARFSPSGRRFGAYYGYGG